MIIVEGYWHYRQVRKTYDFNYEIREVNDSRGQRRRNSFDHLNLENRKFVHLNNQQDQ